MSRITRDIMQISRCSNQFRSDYLAPYGLKSCHAGYLTAIHHHPGLSQDKLARMICFDKSNVARQVAFLEENGFLVRTPSEDDKRMMQLYLTPKAERLIPVIEEMYTLWSGRLTQDLTEAEFEQLADLIGKLKFRAAEWMEAR